MPTRRTRIWTVKGMLVMANSFKLILCIALFAFAMAACDNSPPLERTTERQMATISGEFYTESPEEIQSPVKVLFAIDCSLSMLSSDPIIPVEAPRGRRIAAVQSYLDTYNTEQFPNVSFSIILWNDGIIDQTVNGNNVPGFTRSREDLASVLNNTVSEGETDYLGAIERIRTTIDNDIISVSNQEDGEFTVPRTKYVVLFFSDGMAQSMGVNQDPIEIENAVQDLRDMADERGVGQFNFHTLFLSALFRYFDANGNLQTYPELIVPFATAESTLMNMARVGNGAYVEIAQATDIDFLTVANLRLNTEYEIKYILAYNYNVLPGTDTLYPDSDGDGLTDELEMEQYGTDPTMADTDNDGLSDFFEIKMQRFENGNYWPNPLMADTDCRPTSTGYWPDQDSDGLFDCEETTRGTYRFFPDWDSDGIPDGIEFVTGTNPREEVYTSDADFDGVLDRHEVMIHSNALANDPTVRERFAYQYSLVYLGHPDPIQQPDLPYGIRRYSFTISNISIMTTLGTAPGDRYNLAPNDNFIRIYIAQVPEDRPNAPPVFRMAEIYINENDPSRDVTVGPNDFELLD